LKSYIDPTYISATSGDIWNCTIFGTRKEAPKTTNMKIALQASSYGVNLYFTRDLESEVSLNSTFLTLFMIVYIILLTVILFD